MIDRLMGNSKLLGYIPRFDPVMTADHSAYGPFEVVVLFFHLICYSIFFGFQFR